MHGYMYGGMSVCAGIRGVLEQADKDGLSPEISLVQPPFLFWVLATVSVGVLKCPQCREGGGRGSHSSGGGARSGSPLGLLPGHLPNPGGEALICLGFSAA